MNKQIFTTVLTISSLLLPLSAEASSFTGINIFGDSLVDTGNLFKFTNLPPSPPYFEGRFSNEKIWVDTLADNFNLNPILSSELGTTIPTEGVNFAFGGATTGFSNIGGDSLPGLQQQINSFQALTTIQPADADALNIIWAGANDYIQAFSSPDGLASIGELPGQATDNLSGAVESLYEAGARDFLVVNLPDLGETPFFNQIDRAIPGTANQLNDLTSAHNGLLDQKLNTLETSLSEIDIITLDANSLLKDILAQPSQFGFSDIDNSCLSNFQPGFIFDDVCDNPDEFLFWDDLHPTSATNDLVAQLALDTLDQKERVPEPNSIWSLFGLISLILLRFSIYKCRSAR